MLKSWIKDRTFASALCVPVQGVIRSERISSPILDRRIVRISIVGARHDSAIVLEVRLE